MKQQLFRLGHKSANIDCILSFDPSEGAQVEEGTVEASPEETLRLGECGCGGGLCSGNGSSEQVFKPLSECCGGGTFIRVAHQGWPQFNFGLF